MRGVLAVGKPERIELSCRAPHHYLYTRC